MAWLHTVPKGSDKPRQSVHDTNLPDIEGCEFILRHFEAMGAISYGFDGAVGLSWPEIEAYCRLHFNMIPYWLPALLHRLSAAYASQSRKSREPKCLPPYLLSTGGDTMSAIRSNVDKALEDFF